MGLVRRLHNWPADKWCSDPNLPEECVMENGVVVKMHGNRVARGRQSVYLLIPRRAVKGNDHEEPVIANLFNMCDPATALNGADGTFPTPLSLIRKTQGQKMPGQNATAYAKIEAWMDGYKQ